MKRNEPHNDQTARPVTPEDFSLGSAYLDYCVRKGWLIKSGDGAQAKYAMTDTGKRKLDHVSLNFDLSGIATKSEGPKKKRKRFKK